MRWAIEAASLCMQTVELLCPADDVHQPCSGTEGMDFHIRAMARSASHLLDLLSSSVCSCLASLHDWLVLLSLDT